MFYFQQHHILMSSKKHYFCQTQKMLDSRENKSFHLVFIKKQVYLTYFTVCFFRKVKIPTKKAVSATSIYLL
jgi:hypothetical protein